MKLSTCIYQFFDQYLPRIKGGSRKTIKAYRDAFSLLLPFSADHLGIKIESLQIEHLSTELILAFLDHLESARNNRAATRNHRLAAIKSLAKMIRLLYPEYRPPIRAVCVCNNTAGILVRHILHSYSKGLPAGNDQVPP